jgi:hypothetical protein
MSLVLDETSVEKLDRLLGVIREVHSQRGDDICWMDTDKIFEVAGLPVPKREVGDRAQMLENCSRFIDQLCTVGRGNWPSYAELEQEAQSWKEKFEKHTEVVAQYMSALYATMVDPLADGEIKVSEMMQKLSEAAAAQRQRDSEKLAEHENRIKELKEQLRFANYKINDLKARIGRGKDHSEDASW